MMHPIDYILAVVLGIVEGLTEFIPVSSTGHLILIVDLLKFNGPPGHVFEIVIQLGAISAIIWAYWHKFWNVGRQLHYDRGAQRFVANIGIAFMPSMVLGFVLHKFIKEDLFDPTVVSVALIVGGFLILWIERLHLRMVYHTVEAISWKRALAVGFCQVVSMIPGTSRSGATIMGALLLGLDRKTATEMSFFLAIPTMLGATTLDIYKHWDVLSLDNLEIIAIGFISAFIAALLVVKTVVRFVSTHGFTPFAYYRIMLGVVMLVLLYA